MTEAGGIWGWAADRIIAPVLVALIFSWVVAMMIERHRARREFLTKEVDALRASLNEHWMLASTYWGQNEVTDQIAIEERIQFLEEEIRTVAMELGEYFGKDFRQEVVKLCGDLSKAATGGAFGSPDRRPDETRLKLVRTAAVRLRSALQNARRRNLENIFRITR